MLKKKKYKSTALLLAMLMLFSSMSYSLDLHLCQGKIKHVALFGHAKTCSELEVKPDCFSRSETFRSGQEISRKKCCSDKTAFVQMDGDFTSLMDGFNYPAQVSTSLENIYWSPLNIDVRVDPEYLNYRPPLIKTDPLILYQVFLI